MQNNFCSNAFIDFKIENQLGNRKQEAGNRKQEAGYMKQGTGSRVQDIVIK